ncbi:MAG: hypothetical protein ACTSQF_08970 [Candidatus Heimdallarchaeaceae archaeon]
MPELRVLEKAKKRFLENKYDILLQIAIIVILFVISMIVRIYLRAWIYSNYDLSVTVTNALFYSYDNPEAYTWEIFPDAQTYYVDYLDAFRYEQWNPYLLDRGFPLTGYVYGPIFIYGLTIVSFIIDIFFPGLSVSQKTWLSVTTAPLIFDSITTVFIYAILLKKKDGKRSIVNILYSAAAAIIFIFMPVVLFYNDTLYLNTYMFTTFTVISLYFLSRDKHKESALFLAIAILTKLNALFIAPLWLVYVARNNLREGIEFLVVLIFSFLVLSIPWILISPRLYFYQQLWPGQTGNTHFGIEPQYMLWSTTPTHSFLYWAQETGSVFWSDAAEFYWSANQLYLPLLIFVAICCMVMLLVGTQMKENRSSLFSYTAMFTIGSHMFLSRGNYKYYDPFFIPFVVIAVASWGENLDSKLPKFVRSISGNLQNDQKDENELKIREKIKSIIEKKSFLIAVRILGFLIFCGIISWVFVLNFWVIFKVKWLHMFYTFLLAVTMIAIFNFKTHIALLDKRNYTKLFSYIKYESQNFLETLRNFSSRVKKIVKRIVKRKEESSLNEEKLS